MKTFVAYYRVSTAQQGKSGLGLEAQQADVKRFTQDSKLIAEFTEIESGANNKRPQLNKAIAKCLESNSTLVIAKLDRLSRNVLFIETLKTKGVKFVCCDMPEANEFMIGIMAQLAQYERKIISDRIKAALTAAKARGTKLGGSTKEHCDQMRANRKPKKVDAKTGYIITHELKAGKSYTQIAELLNKYELVTSRNKPHTAVSVYRIAKKLNIILPK